MVNLDAFKCEKPNPEFSIEELGSLTETLSEDEISVISGGARAIGGGFMDGEQSLAMVMPNELTSDA